MDIDVKDPKVVRWLIAGLLVVLMVPVYFMTDFFPFTYKARQADYLVLETRHNELSRDLEKARLLVRNLDRVEREYDILRQQWVIAQTLLPEENEMPELLRKVTAAGEQSGVQFELFRPQSPMNQGFYSSNPIEVKVAAGYHQTGVFLSRLANLNRIVNVTGLKMSGMTLDEKNRVLTVETSMTLTAYTLGSTPGLPADGA